jgi:hypothetical protein
MTVAAPPKNKKKNLEAFPSYKQATPTGFGLRMVNAGQRVHYRISQR